MKKMTYLLAVVAILAIVTDADACGRRGRRGSCQSQGECSQQQMSACAPTVSNGTVAAPAGQPSGYLTPDRMVYPNVGAVNYLGPKQEVAPQQPACAANGTCGQSSYPQYSGRRRR